MAYLDLLVLEDLWSGCLPYVEQLTLEGENSVPIPPNHAESRNGERFGGVSLCEDEGAVLSVQPKAIHDGGEVIVNEGLRPTG